MKKLMLMAFTVALSLSLTAKAGCENGNTEAQFTGKIVKANHFEGDQAGRQYLVYQIEFSSFVPNPGCVLDDQAAASARIAQSEYDPSLHEGQEIKGYLVRNGQTGAFDAELL